MKVELHQSDQDEGQHAFRGRALLKLRVKTSEPEGEHAEELAVKGARRRKLKQAIQNVLFFGLLSVTMVRAMVAHRRVASSFSEENSAEMDHRALQNKAPVVAHCFTGQVRTLAHPMIYQNYEAHILSKIGADSDIFFAIEKETNATDIFHPTNIKIDSTTTWQYDRWGACLEMVKQEEVKQNKEYSHIIITRPDLVILQDIPTVDDFPEETIWVRKYGEQYQEFVSTFSHGDEDAESVQTPHQGDYGSSRSDMFLVIPRKIAGPFMRTMSEKRNGLKEICGNGRTKEDLCGNPSGNYPECTVKCAFDVLSVQYVLQSFQVRILREHQLCKSHFTDGGKWFNSMCI